MNFSKQLPQELSTHALVAERQRYYSQAVAACLARLQRAVDLLQQPLLSDVQSAGLHRDLHDQTERLNTLMRQIMAAGALGAQAAGDADWPEPVALRGVLTTLVGEYQALCSEHRYRLRLSGLPAAPAYAMPSVLIVFQLLLDNALRRAPPGEVIEIAAEDDAENTEWIFHISDKGTGLPPDRLALVFDDPSLAAPAAVYGLGLSLAKFVVEALGGRIWAASERGQGATFSFSLPRRPLPRRWIVTRPKVLVIEENTELCAALRAGYDEAGFEVETAPTAEAGLTLVPAFGPNLILLELSPGSFAGQACLATLRQCSNAAVIFLVAPDARHAVADALWQGASDCLVKPFHIRELIARTRAILRRRPAAPFADPRDAGRPRPFLFQQAKINPLLQ